MIFQQKEPLFNVYLTRPRERFPNTVSRHRQGPRALSLVRPDAASDPRSDHGLSHFQPATRHRDSVRSQHCRVALLHVHGLGEVAMDAGVGDALGGYPQPAV